MRLEREAAALEVPGADLEEENWWGQGRDVDLLGDDRGDGDEREAMGNEDNLSAAGGGDVEGELMLEDRDMDGERADSRGGFKLRKINLGESRIMKKALRYRHWSVLPRGRVAAHQRSASLPPRPRDEGTKEQGSLAIEVDLAPTLGRVKLAEVSVICEDLTLLQWGDNAEAHESEPETHGLGPAGDLVLHQPRE